MKVLVTTPNGKVGSELVKLLQKGNIPFRLGAHTVERARKQFPGAEVVRLDYQDPASMKAAVQGVDAVYLASPGDFPSAPEKQLIDAAKAAGVKRAVKLSVMGADQSDNPLRQVEEHLETSGLQHTVVRPTWFMQNYSTSGAQGVRGGTIHEPAAGGRNAFIDARDIAAVIFAALTKDGHAGKIYALTGPELLDRTQVAKTFSQELGRDVKYVPISDEQFRAAVKDVLTPSYTDLLSYLYAGVRAGSGERKTDDVKKVLGREPISFAQFVRDHRSIWS